MNLSYIYIKKYKSAYTMKYVILTILFCSFSILSAQSDSSHLDIRKVEVIKAFEAGIQDATLLKVKPVTPPTTNYKPNYTYIISEFPVKVQEVKPQILPLAIQQDPPFIVNKGFLFGSFGLKNNINFLGGYSLYQKDRYDAGIHVGYESLDNSKTIPFQKYNQTQIALYGNYLLKENLKLYGQVNTSFKNRYLYNQDSETDTLFTDADLKRKLNASRISVGIANPEPTAWDINYDVNLDLHNLSIGTNKSKDNGITLRAMAEKQFGTSSVLYFNASYDYTAYRDSLQYTLSVADFKPHFKTKIGNLLLDGGVSMLYTADGQSTVFPEAEIALSVNNGSFMVFAGLHQNHFANTFANLAEKNPYLNTKMDSLKTTVWQEYNAGIKGKFSFLGYQIKAGYKSINNQMFMLNNHIDISIFDLVFDDISSKFISGNLNFNFSDKLEFGGWLTQNFFSLDSIDKAWHTPALEANAFAVYKLLDNKLRIRSDLFLGSPISYINKSGVEDKSGVLFDFNIEANYALTDNFHINVQGINLLNNTFERYYGYPSAGILVRAGIRWVF